MLESCNQAQMNYTVGPSIFCNHLVSTFPYTATVSRDRSYTQAGAAARLCQISGTGCSIGSSPICAIQIFGTTLCAKWDMASTRFPGLVLEMSG